jgi:hypothetical protein
MLKIVNKKLDWVKANQQNYFLWKALPTIYLFGDQFIQGPPWPWSNWSYGSEIYYAISSYRHWCPIRNKNCLWRPCVLMDREQIINLYREPSIDASYQVSVHLAKRFQRRRFFRNQPIRNKNCLWWPCLLMEQDEMSNCNRGLSIDASYQVPVHLAKRFQRRRI